MDIFKQYTEIFGHSPSVVWSFFLDMINGKAAVSFESLNDLAVAEILAHESILCRCKKQENGRTDEKIEKLLLRLKSSGIELNNKTSDELDKKILPDDQSLEEIHRIMLRSLAVVNQCIYLLMLVTCAEELQKKNPGLGLDVLIPIIHDEYTLTKKYEKHVWIQIKQTQSIN